MSRGLTQEQKDYLDKAMKEYRQRTGIAMGSVRRLSNQDYDHVLEMNDLKAYTKRLTCTCLITEIGDTISTGSTYH